MHLHNYIILKSITCFNNTKYFGYIAFYTDNLVIWGVFILPVPIWIEINTIVRGIIV